MEMKKIGMGGALAGILLFVLMVLTGYAIGLVIPMDIGQYGGMRAMDDPVMTLFFLYPFVVAFAAAVLFDTVHSGPSREQNP